MTTWTGVNELPSLKERKATALESRENLIQPAMVTVWPLSFS